MPAKMLFDASNIDLTKTIITREEIYEVNPHRHEFMLLDGIIHHDAEGGNIIGYRETRDDEFWVKGHIPGRPLFPGVLMIEAAAQLAAFMIRRTSEDSEFIGFIGCDKVKFRGQVVPGQRLLLLGRQLLNLTSRRVVCETQGVVDGTLVFEAKITGMPI